MRWSDRIIKNIRNQIDSTSQTELEKEILKKEWREILNDQERLINTLEKHLITVVLLHFICSMHCSTSINSQHSLPSIFHTGDNTLRGKNSYFWEATIKAYDAYGQRTMHHAWIV